MSRLLLFSIVMCLPFLTSASTDHGAMKSWVESANDPDTDFPIQNLPYGVFKRNGSPEKGRIGIAIGNYVLDVYACIETRLLDDLSQECRYTLQQDSLNAFMSLGKAHWSQVRRSISKLLEFHCPTLKDNETLKSKLLIPFSQISLHMPVDIGDYTDFYASIHHATHIGSMLRPNNPLMPNYRHMPIGYHGRASSVIISGTPITWPSGQILGTDGIPKFNLCQKLDFELEIGALIGPGNALGCPIPISQASDHIFGLVLVNDWSARDIQLWEYQPLGPFNGKNFATTMSPWIVTYEALEPYQEAFTARKDDDPVLLDYLLEPSPKTLNIVVEASLSSNSMRKDNQEPFLICQGNFSQMYWTFEHLVCHHTAGGCNLRPGDLIASGTISGDAESTLGCLLERSALKMEPLQLTDGTSRQYLQDGDEVILRAYTQKDNLPRIGFGECRGVVTK